MLAGRSRLDSRSSSDRSASRERLCYIHSGAGYRMYALENYLLTSASHTGFIEDGPETSSRKKQKRSKDKDSSKKRRKDSDDGES
jgi:hypothetical protein